ncbi:MAG: hypothetical protein AAFO58_13160, partial [Pseudomonadota bacterium]
NPKPQTPNPKNLKLKKSISPPIKSQDPTGPLLCQKSLVTISLEHRIVRLSKTHTKILLSERMHIPRLLNAQPLQRILAIHFGETFIIEEVEFVVKVFEIFRRQNERLPLFIEFVQIAYDQLAQLAFGGRSSEKNLGDEFPVDLGQVVLLGVLCRF